MLLTVDVESHVEGSDRLLREDFPNVEQAMKFATEQFFGNKNFETIEVTQVVSDAGFTEYLRVAHFQPVVQDVTADV